MSVVVTRATGGTAKPVGVLYVEPDQQVLDAGAATALAEAGVDAAATADLLSACLAHERCGIHLYRSVAGRTTIAELRERYEHFGAETVEHARRLEALVGETGGDPQYVSPAARATEKAAAGLVESTYLLAGSVDPPTAELAMLEAVMLAEAKDRANWVLLAQIAARMAAGEVRDRFEAVVDAVLEEEEEHYSWAHDTRAAMLLARATGSPEPAVSSRRPEAEDVIDLSSQTRDELYVAAQELEIEGRSQMTKDQLARAVAERTGDAP